MALIINTPFGLLRILVAVAESRNFREAALKLQISQPAVSMKLKELEALQPIPIFSLEGKRKVLTHYGRSLYEVARESARDIEQKIENLHRLYSSPEHMTVRIGGRHEVLEYIAPLLEFEGRIEFVNLSGQAAIDRLMRHEIDIGISYILPNSTEIHAKKLFQSTTYFVVHENFLKRKKLTRDTFKNRDFLIDTPCVSYHRDGHLIRNLANYSDLNFADLNVKFITEDWRTVQSLVEQGFGYAVVPFYAVSKSEKILKLELPTSAVPDLSYYAIFETGLKKINAFKKLLSFSRILKI